MPCKNQLECHEQEKLHLYVEINMLGNSLVVDIIDNGVSIPNEIRENIFKHNISTNGEGRGYGLWRANYICEKEINGKLELLPDRNDEKIFRITIPTSFSIKSAIIVDDDEAWRDILGRWLEQAGLSIKTASNIEEAQALLTSDLIVDYVFLDISLDDEHTTNVDGLKLAKMFSKKMPAAKRIILTAYPDRANKYSKDVHAILNKLDDSISDEDGFFTILLEKGISIR